MPLLSEWYFATVSNLPEDSQTFLAWGNVKGHEKLPDGMFIHTSMIKNVSLVGDVLIVDTANTEYTCALQDFRLSTDSPAYEKMLANICDKFSIPDILPKMQESVRGRLAEINAYKQEIKDDMYNDTIYLEFSDDHNYLYNFGIYKSQDGETYDLNKTVAADTFRDTVTLNIKRTYHPLPPNNLEPKTEDIAVHYSPFKGNIIEFYSVHPSSLKGGQYFGKIKNSGKLPLTVIFSWGLTAVIPPDSSINVNNQVTGDLYDRVIAAKLYPEENECSGIKPMPAR